MTSAADPELIEPRTDRKLLSTLRSLLALGQVMTEASGEREILELATTAAPSLAPCRVVCVELVGEPPCRPEVAAQLSVLGGRGGGVGLAGHAWAWAYPLHGLSTEVGHLVVAGSAEPTSTEQFLLRALAQQTGVALGNQRLHDQEQDTARTLSGLNQRLQETVRALRLVIEIHERLTAVAMAREGSEGIARAVHELTGYPVAIEDRHGNLRAWAGPDRPEPYPKDSPTSRERLLRRALDSGRPIRDGGRVLVLAHPHGDVLGVILLVDPTASAGEQELIALEHGATILAMELARVRSMAESQLRLRRDLVEELLTATDEEDALHRAAALGYDLRRPHRVVVVEGGGRKRDDEALFHAVRRASRDEPVGTLLVARGTHVVVLAENEADWENYRASILRELGGGRARVGIGERCERVAHFPRSYRQAVLALRLTEAAEHGDRATCFDDLGVYRLLAEIEKLDEVEHFVRRWLGALLDYDRERSAELVRTLSQFLECGGSYEATAKVLIVHRSTLKYRLQRIQQISGLTINDPDTRFNLMLAARAWRTLQVLAPEPARAVRSLRARSEPLSS